MQAINVVFVPTGAGLGSLRAGQGLSMQVIGVLVSSKPLPCGKRLICTFTEFLITSARSLHWIFSFLKENKPTSSFVFPSHSSQPNLDTEDFERGLELDFPLGHFQPKAFQDSMTLIQGSVWKWHW